MDSADDAHLPSDHTKGSAAIAPWGSPGTPLVPQWYKQNHPNLTLPSRLRALGETVADLDVWQPDGGDEIDHASLRSLVDLASTCQPPYDHVVVPAGVGSRDLKALPLRPRTLNGILRSGLLGTGRAVTVGDLLALRSFGYSSLLDVMCVIEAASDRGLLNVSWPSADQDAEDATNGVTQTRFIEGLLAVADDMKTLLAAAHEYLGADTLQDALQLDLGSLAATLGIDVGFRDLHLERVLGDLTIAGSIVVRVESVLSGLTSVEQTIVDRRIFVADPPTLEELGRDVGLTRERVRQLQVRVLDAIESAVGHDIDGLSRLVARSLGPFVRAAELERRVTEIFPDDRSATALTRRMLTSRLQLTPLGGWLASADAVKQVQLLKSAASNIADDVGLIDDEKLRQATSDEHWLDHWQPLVDCCEFFSITGELALRDTAKARVKAGLLHIGRSATKEEIARAAGIDVEKIGSQLSVIPSVVRADKHRWGMRDWIDDEYEGIPAEIVQRIDEDGGATLLERLLTELPERFAVSEGSVKAYVATAQFVLRDGYVSLANESTLSFRPLEDVVTGRDSSGIPYWSFVVEDRYFHGYSLVGVPPEIARELGCEPNGHARVDLSHPPGCPPLSVNWRLSSLTGAEIGYLSEPLRHLGVASGDRVRLMLTGTPLVELRADASVTGRSANQPESSESLLERIKNRRKLL